MDPDDINARSLTSALYEEFSKSSRPLTVGDAAEILGLMAAQHEANIAMFSLVLKAVPKAVETNEMLQAKDALMFTGQTFHRAISRLVHLANQPDENNV